MLAITEFDSVRICSSALVDRGRRFYRPRAYEVHASSDPGGTREACERAPKGPDVCILPASDGAGRAGEPPRAFRWVNPGEEERCTEGHEPTIEVGCC